MEFERLSRLLEPLIPGQVRRWLKIHAFADAETKVLIERQVQLTAERMLGDGRHRILLSLPPQRVIKGAFHLGTVMYDRDRWPAGLESGEFLQGICVFGRSGSGKTNAVFHLLLQLAERRVPFLFLDWKRTGRHLIPLLGSNVNVYTPGRSLCEFPFNPFVPPPGFETQAYAGLVADQLAAAYTLGDGAVGLIQRALRTCYERSGGSCSLSDLIAEVERAGGHSRAKGWQASALRALRSLEFSRALPAGVHSSTITPSTDPNSPTAAPSTQASVASAPAVSSAGNAEVSHHEQLSLVRTLLHAISIVELDALPQGAKRFLIPLLCLWIYHVRLALTEREKLRFVIVVEEAHHVLHARPHGTHESVMEMLLRQCRELGIAMIVVDQHPHLISSAALGNTYTTLCFNLKDPSDAARAAAATLVDDRRCFGMLSVGHAVVKLQDRWRRPFLVRFPKVDVHKGSVTDEVLARFMAEKRAGSAGTGQELAELARVRRVPRHDRLLQADELRFIEDVVNVPEDGVKARYRRLGLSGHRGHGIKQRLVREGWLEGAVVPVGRSRKVVLRPGREARGRLDLPPAGTQREGIAHSYWKHVFARRLEDTGWVVRIEAPRVGGAADIVATSGTTSIAVEVETGRSDVVANVRHGLRAGYGRVVVAATDPTALAAVDAALARAGLLVPGRVEVVAAWQPWAPPSPTTPTYTADTAQDTPS
ncbi:hypothetical protein PHYC_02023 [Phycisphaerales bacterium]|nr:hypothetical protein PHYC_02023 [Phycisphaerales bacterium]